MFFICPLFLHTGFPFGETEQRPPPPGYPGQFGPRGQNPAGLERWHDQQGMIRPPHPGQVRPGKLAKHGVHNLFWCFDVKAILQI